MQLELALYSYLSNCIAFSETDKVVLFKTTSKDSEEAYDILKSSYKEFIFVRENENFEFLVRNLISHGEYEYTLFVVDDTVFTRRFSIDSMINHLKNDNSAIGFSLRLGRNTRHCYPLGIGNQMPFIDDSGMFDYKMGHFNWRKVNFGDFGYPLELSSSLYKTEDVLKVIENAPFANPNELEWIMYLGADKLEGKSNLYCYKQSVAFSNPINKVQNVNQNRSGTKEKYSPEHLTKKFLEGYRINYRDFINFESNGCHQEVDIELLKEEQ